MHMTELSRAPLSAYKSLHSAILCGETLNEIKQIERSIARFGLLSPLIVSAVHDQLIVIDGKKRLAAIKRMTFAGTLPASLEQIPYIFIHDAKKTDLKSTSVLSPREVYKAVMELKSEGQSFEDIAASLYLCRRIILDVIKLSRLFPTIREAYFKKLMTFNQAIAYASLPDHMDQIALLGSLGPSAQAEAVLNAIKGLPSNSKEKPNPRRSNDRNIGNTLVMPMSDYVSQPDLSTEFIWTGRQNQTQGQHAA